METNIFKEVAQILREPKPRFKVGYGPEYELMTIDHTPNEAFCHSTTPSTSGSSTNSVNDLNGWGNVKNVNKNETELDRHFPTLGTSVRAPKPKECKQLESDELEAIGQPETYKKKRVAVILDSADIEPPPQALRSELNSKFSCAPIDMDYTKQMKCDWQARLSEEMHRSNYDDYGVDIDYKFLDEIVKDTFRCFDKRQDNEYEEMNRVESIQLGPSIVESLMNKCSSSKVPCKLDSSNVDHDKFPITNVVWGYNRSNSGDPLNLAMAFVPDKYNYDKEIAEFKRTLVLPLVAQMFRKEMSFHPLKCSYAVSLGPGFIPQLLFDYDIDPCACIYDTNNTSELSKTYDNIIEIPLCIDYLDKYMHREGERLQEKSVKVIFPNAEAATKAMSDRKDLRPFLHLPLNESRSHQLSMKVKWYTSPSKGKSTITLKNPEDLEFATEVLRHHLIPVFTPFDASEFQSDKKIFVQWANHSANLAKWDEDEFNRIVRLIFEKNDIELDHIRFEKYDPTISNEIHLRTQINRRLVKAALNAGVWKGVVPTTEEDWQEILKNQNGQMGWKVRIGKTTTKTTEAMVLFDENTMENMAICEYLASKTPDSLMFRLHDRDSHGVDFRPSYQIKIPMDKDLRKAYDKVITALDEEFRTETNTDMKNYLRILDTSSSTGIVVDGWPMRDVDFAVDGVRHATKGVTIDCSNTNTYGRLLYGVGYQVLMNKLGSLNGRVVVRTLVGERKLILHGEPGLIEDMQAFLSTYLREWKNVKVRAPIVLSTPKYSITLKHLVFKMITDGKLGRLVGGGTFERITREQLIFNGKWYQMDNLYKVLDYLDKKLYQETVREPYNRRPMCLLCSNLVPREDCVTLEACGHRYCGECISRMVPIHIRDRNLPIRCPEKQCNYPLTVDDVLLLLRGPIRNNKWYLDECSNQIIEALTDCYLRTNKNAKRCQSPNCKEIFLMKSADGKFVEARCPQCFRPCCGNCSEEPHEPHTCAEFHKMRNDPILSLQVYGKTAKGSLQKCPTEGCGAVIEKQEGCNHMECTYCHMHFCWTCDFLSPNVSEVYAHLREKHGGMGGGWVEENGRIVQAPDEDLGEDEIVHQLIAAGEII